jgi:N6-L-threonylcarbamoyladenine synthase
MIAWAGAERLALGLTDSLHVAPRARWPLSDVSKPTQEETERVQKKIAEIPP